MGTFKMCKLNWSEKLVIKNGLKKENALFGHYPFRPVNIGFELSKNFDFNQILKYFSRVSNSVTPTKSDLILMPVQYLSPILISAELDLGVGDRGQQPRSNFDYLYC